MSNLLRNLGYSLRRLRKNPGLTLIILLTLALGIGANTAMFTIDYASMIAPIPYPNPDQLVVIWSKIQEHNAGVSAGDFIDWKRQSSAFQELSAVTSTSFNISTQDRPEFINGWRCTPGLFLVRGVKFMLGRDFLDEEGQAGRDHVISLSYRLWKRLGSDRNILGKTLRLNSEPYTVVGVWAEDTPESRNYFAQFITPLVFKPEQINHDDRWMLVVGRLKPGVTIPQAQADMDRVTGLIAKAYPASNKGWGASVEQLKNDFFPKEQRKIFWLLLGAVGFVLLIACVNIANLLLANGMTTQKEVAVRIALGANRRAIFVQQLTEGVILALVGGLLGLGVGYGMLRATIAVIPVDAFPAEADVRLNLPILVTMFAVTTMAGLLFGSIPAWYASRVNPGEALKEGGRSGTGAGRHRLRRALVVGEFALALPLLAGAGLAIHSFWNLEGVDLGVRTDHVLTFGLQVPESRPKAPDQVLAYYRQILDRVKSVPGVTHAAVTTGMPLRGGFGLPFTVAGKASSADPSQRTFAILRAVTPEYFQTFGIRLLNGRPISDQDIASGVKVALVSQELVDKFLKGSDPLQQRILVPQITPGAERPGPPVEWQIVGVFHNTRSFDFRQDFPEIVVPFVQSPWPSANFGVLTSGDPATMTKTLAAAVNSVDPDIALAEPRTMEQIRSELLVNDSFMAILFGSFAVIALLLAGVGIYGVMAFSVAQRSHEIAIRMALGASRNRVVSLVVREGLLLACVGLGLGLIGAYFVGRAMQSLLYGVHAMDFSAFGAVGAVLLLTALLACFFPARRAASVEPMQALRTE
jgi:putative ABC transport system permease protein